MSKALRSPALHFALIGGVVFLLFGSGSHSRPLTRGTIVISATDVEQLRRDWTAQFASKPDRATEKRLIDDAIDEEILYREALAQHLDESAPLVRDRLLRLASFVEEDAGENARAREEAARGLGLQHRDLVIRRYLVQAMRTALAYVVPTASIDEVSLRAYYERRRDVFRQSARTRLTQVYIRGRDVDAEARARALALRLQSGGIDPQHATELGDPFLHGTELGSLSGEELQRIFGADFAAHAQSALVGRWIGPLTSEYGYHIVWVHEHDGAAPPAFEHVRGRVLHQYLAEESERQLRARLDHLRAMYDVHVEQRG